MIGSAFQPRHADLALDLAHALLAGHLGLLEREDGLPE